MSAVLVVFALLAVATGLTPPTLTRPDEYQLGTTNGRNLLGKDKDTVQLLFWLAVNVGDVGGMQEAYDNGADPEDKTEPSGYQPIHLAVSIGDVNVLLLLLEMGANPDAQTTNGTTPLHYAANHGDVIVTGVLLSAGADPNLADDRGFVALHFAAFANQYQFENGGSQISDQGYSGIASEASTEVSVTAEERSKSSIIGMGEFLSCAETLVSHDADVNAKTHLKETPLHYTPAFDSYQITDLLIKHGADVNAVDSEKETPLHEATAYGAIGVTQLLLINGAKVNVKEQNGMTPIEFICRCKTYVGDSSLTQCAPGKCSGDQDTLVIKKIFQVVADN